MDVHDYLMEQQGLDWSQILSGWVPPLPEEFTLWLVNRFGDIFAVYDDGSVNWLATDSGEVTRVAASRDEFCDLVDVDENANHWLLIPLVDACVGAGKVLGIGQCYGYQLPPVLGGAYTEDNIEPTDISVNYTFLAEIYRQTRDLPDGTRISKVILDRGR